MLSTLIALLSLAVVTPLLPQVAVFPQTATNDRRTEIRETSRSRSAERAPPAGMVLITGGETVIGIDTDRVETLADRNRSKMEEISAETPRHAVLVEPYYVDTTEVTNLQWKVYLDALGRQPSEDLLNYGWPGGKIPEGEEDFPVANVSFTEVMEFLAWCGKRLPTEAEWTRAARGDDDRDYPWGMKWNPKRAQYAAMVSPKPVEVGSYEEGASPFGVLNMAGNMFEWVDSAYAPYDDFKPLKFKQPGSRKTEPLNPSFNRTWKVAKGGCFASPREDLRIDRRLGLDPRSSDAGLGFRTARSLADGVEIINHGYNRLLPPQIPKLTDLDMKDVFAKEIISYLPDTTRPIISGYRYMAFAHPGPDRRSALSTMRKEARDDPVTLGLLVTSEGLQAPTLPPGQYVVAFKSKGESKAHKEKRRNAGDDKETDAPEPAAAPAAGTGDDGGNNATAAFAPWPGVGAAEIVEDIDFPQDKDVILYYNVNNAVVGWTDCPDITDEEHAELKATESNGGRGWTIAFSLENPRSKRMPRFTIPLELAGSGLQ